MYIPGAAASRPTGRGNNGPGRDDTGGSGESWHFICTKVIVMNLISWSVDDLSGITQCVSETTSSALRCRKKSEHALETTFLDQPLLTWIIWNKLRRLTIAVDELFSSILSDEERTWQNFCSPGWEDLAPIYCWQSSNSVNASSDELLPCRKCRVGLNSTAKNRQKRRSADTYHCIVAGRR